MSSQSTGKHDLSQNILMRQVAVCQWFIGQTDQSTHRHQLVVVREAWGEEDGGELLHETVVGGYVDPVFRDLCQTGSCVLCV